METDTLVLPRRRFGRPLPLIDPCLGAYVDPTLSSPKDGPSERPPLGNKLTASDPTAPLDSILALHPHSRRPLIRARSLQPQFLLPNTPADRAPHAPLPPNEPVDGVRFTSDDDQEMIELPPDVTIEAFLQSFAIRRSRNAKTYKRKRGNRGCPAARPADSALLVDSSDPITTDTPHHSQEGLARKKKPRRMRRAYSTKSPACHGTNSLRQRLTRAGVTFASDPHKSGDSQELEFGPSSIAPQFRSRRDRMWRPVDPLAPVTLPAPFFPTSVPAYDSPREPLSHWAAALSEKRQVENSVMPLQTPVDGSRGPRKHTSQLAAQLSPESAALSFVPLNEHEAQLKALRNATNKIRSE